MHWLGIIVGHPMQTFSFYVQPKLRIIVTEVNIAINLTADVGYILLSAHRGYQHDFLYNLFSYIELESETIFRY